MKADLLQYHAGLPAGGWSNRNMGTAGPYSELEYLIMAMVGEGISSGYAMRKEMNRMRGGRWSSESGSVYRVLRRLEADRVVREVRKAGVPNRERTEYELTEYGDTQLASWISFPPDRSEIAFLVDPIRTRSYFLSRLKQADQLRVVKSWIQENKAFIADLEREMNSEINKESVVRNLGYQNLLGLAGARNEWLKKVLAAAKAGQLVPRPKVGVVVDES
jgi:DNA-binding PadR family transcriptional regulator